MKAQTAISRQGDVHFAQMSCSDGGDADADGATVVDSWSAKVAPNSALFLVPAGQCCSHHQFLAGAAAVCTCLALWSSFSLSLSCHHRFQEKLGAQSRTITESIFSCPVRCVQTHFFLAMFSCHVRRISSLLAI